MHHYKSSQCIAKAKCLLLYFSSNFFKLFGDDLQTFTFHCLIKHLVIDAERHGSLAGHSMFSLEGSLGYFNRALNGTRGLPNQFIKSKTIFKST